MDEGLKTITDLKVQKRNKERLNVYLDGEYAFSLSVFVQNLRVGQALTLDQVSALRTSDEFERAKHSAMTLLSHRPRSTDEIRKRLASKGFSVTSVEKAIDRLLELELVDDGVFAAYWVEQRESFKPRGKRALRQELRLKGIDDEIVEAAVAKVDEFAGARRAARGRVSRLAGLERPEFWRKLSSFLRRRGYGYETIKTVVDECWAAHAEDDEQAAHPRND